MKKALRKLIPAMVMLLIAAAFVGTSTYAWFSMNRIVTVNGMTVDTKVSDSLSIAATNAEANYGSSLSQPLSGHLRPVSTVDGLSFFYTNPQNNVGGSGQAINNTFVAYSEAATGNPATNASPDSTSGKSNYDAAFNTAYGVGTPAADTVVYGYIDYVFYIKATNVTGAAEDLKLTTLNLLYDNSTTSTPNWVAVTDKAWRVAVFAQAASKDTANDDALIASDRKAILTINGAANRTANTAVNATDGKGTVTYTSAAWAVDSIASGATEYNKVTVRLWLEGEDTTCNNETFATLSNKYKLDLEFRLGGSDPADAAVLNIGSVVA